jgi:hypothetical protein
MTTSQIENAANRGDLASADFQIGLVLRYKAIPLFLEDVGRIGWRRRTASVQISPSTRSATLPSDFFEASSVWVAPVDDLGDPLKYIGETDRLVAQALDRTTGGRPEGFYLSGSSIYSDRPADKTYSLRVVYFYQIPFSNQSEDIDLSAWIPGQYHWALVELLRRELFFDRYGDQDPRFSTSAQLYQEWLNRITTKRELSRRNEIRTIS